MQDANLGSGAGSTVLLLVLISPLAAAACATAGGRRQRTFIARLGAAAAGLSLLMSAALAIIVFRPGAAAVSVDLWTGSAGPAPLALTGDRVAVALLLLVTSVSAVVQSFAVRYLAEDARAGWFTAAAGLLTASSAGLMCAATLLSFALCWSVAGVALWLLLGTYRQLPAARAGQARTAQAFLVGDAALWLAVGIASARFGTVSLRSVERAALAGHPAATAAIACLLVVAALSRSAQLPLHRWLPVTLAAPTPVSALLHAGVVNAGGVLLIRLSPLVHPSAAATVLAVTAGGLTAAYASVLMLAKPDIKGSLTYSTMAQMGFMVLACGLGLYAAALFHLIAHGLYKASLFLASGGQTHRVLRRAAAPPAPAQAPAARAIRLVLAAAIPGAALLSAQQLLPGSTHAASTWALLLFAWASAATALHSWARRAPDARSAVAISALIAVACGLYVGLVHLITTALAPALPAVAPAEEAPWLLVAATLALAALGAVIRLGGSGRLAGLHRSLYVRALAAGHVQPARPRRSPEPHTRRWAAREQQPLPATSGGTP